MTRTLPKKTAAKAKPAKAPISNDDGYALVTDRVIAALEAGVVPWHRPWATTGFPRSLSSGKAYQGVNVLLLGISSSLNGYANAWWGTYKQIAEQGGQVRRGEKATSVTLWRPIHIGEVQADGSKKAKKILLLRTFQVFNVEQADWADGLPAKCEVVANEHDPVEAAEAIVATYFNVEGGPTLAHDGGDRAYYQPSTDGCHLPRREAFESADGYYSTLFHEATHSTGHSTRLKREGVTEGHHFGSVEYSREELVAQIGAAYICGALGIDNGVVEESAAYLAGWLKVFQGDRKVLLSAASAAQKAADLVRGIKAAEAAPEAPVEAPVAEAVAA